MKHLIILIMTMLSVTTHLQAQDLKMPTLEDLIPGGETYRYAKNIYGLKWWGDKVLKPEIDSVFTINPANGKETLLFTRQELNSKLEVAGVKTLSHLYNISMPWAEETKVLLSAASPYVCYNWKTGEVTKRDDIKVDGEANIDFHTGSGNVACTVGNNLYVNGQQVTNEPAGIVCGQTVHRNEFGISKGTFWSPQGNKLAFYRMDESMVTEYPLVDITARIGEVNKVRYPMAGMTSHQVKVGIYNPTDKSTIYLQTGDPTDRYFTNISWSPDEKSLFLIEVNRDQNHAKLCEFNTEDGKLIGIIYEEKHPKYVEPEHPIIFLPWDEEQFIYQSEKDGFNHLYLMNRKGEMKALTSGEWLVQEVVGFNAKKKEVIIISTERSPLQSDIYSVNVNNGKRQWLGEVDGVHRAQLSASGTYLIDTYQTPEDARVIEIRATNGKGKVHQLLKAENPYKDFIMPRIEMGTMKAADGVTDLHYRIMKPADFDPNKTYPAIVYVYGGPHAQMVTNGFLHGARGWDIYMANKGYIMLSIDNRGSDNRGLEFENATFRKLGIEEGKDQAKAAEWLASLPYVDKNRIGVHGWSFGGHMTTALMLRYPDIYRVGVAGGPVIDWALYEVMYGERYMDTPESNPEGYKKADLTQRAGDLKGRLQIIIGANDPVCVPQHSISFLRACIDAGTQPDYFIYPGDGHNMFGRDRVHLYTRITRYFEDYLK